MRKIQFIAIALIGAFVVLAPITQGLIMTTQTFPVILVITGGMLNFISVPITQWIINHYYTYQAEVNQTDIIWNLTAPYWLDINSTGMVAGIPSEIDTGNFQVAVKATNIAGDSVFQNYTLVVSAFSATDWTIMLLVFAFIVLLILGFFERFAMVGAALVAAFIAVLSWTVTGSPFVPAIFVLMMTVCIGLAITKKASSK